MLKGPLLNFLSKTFPGETLCKFTQIFPPKDLVYIGTQLVELVTIIKRDNESRMTVEILFSPYQLLQ